MNTTQTQLTGKIMRRVYAIYLFRRIFSPTLVKVYILIALGWQSTFYMSLPDIFANTTAILGEGDLMYFSRAAIVNTETATLILATGALVVFLWLCKDLLKLTPSREVAL